MTRRTHPRPTLPRLAILVLAVAAAVAGCGGAAASLAPAPASTGPASSTSAGAMASDAPPSATPGASVADLPTATLAPTQAEIVELEARVATDPEDAGAQRDLGLALLQRIRETADPSLYAPAEAALEQARRIAPDDILALVGIGGLQLGRHQFAEALATGRAAVRAFPGYAPAHGVLLDALVELGRYKEAATEVDRMVALSSDLASLARLSYVRELHGDLAGALNQMQQAAASPVSPPRHGVRHRAGRQSARRERASGRCARGVPDGAGDLPRPRAVDRGSRPPGGRRG